MLQLSTEIDKLKEELADERAKAAISGSTSEEVHSMTIAFKS